MEDLLQKAAEAFAANWGHDFYGKCESIINSTGRVLSQSGSSGESTVRIATDVWVFRIEYSRYAVAHYTEIHEMNKVELLKDTGPDYSTAFVPSCVIDVNYDEFDLMSTNFITLSNVPTQVIYEASRLLADALEDNGYEVFFQNQFEWEYELPPLHPIIRRELKKKCREHSKKIKAKVQKQEKARVTFDLRINHEQIIIVRTGEPVFWTSALSQNIAIFNINFRRGAGRGPGEIRRAIKFNQWLQEKREVGLKVTSAQGVWQGLSTNGLDVIFGISKDEVQLQRRAADMDCALYIRAGEVLEMV